MGIATFLSTLRHRLNKKTNFTVRTRLSSVKVPNSCSSNEYWPRSAQSDESSFDGVRKTLNFDDCEAPSTLSRGVFVYADPPVYPEFEVNDDEADLEGVYDQNLHPSDTQTEFCVEDLSAGIDADREFIRKFGGLSLEDGNVTSAKQDWGHVTTGGLEVSDNFQLEREFSRRFINSPSRYIEYFIHPSDSSEIGKVVEGEYEISPPAFWEQVTTCDADVQEDVQFYPAEFLSSSTSVDFEDTMNPNHSGAINDSEFVTPERDSSIFRTEKCEQIANGTAVDQELDQEELEFDYNAFDFTSAMRELDEIAANIDLGMNASALEYHNSDQTTSTIGFICEQNEVEFDISRFLRSSPSGILVGSPELHNMPYQENGNEEPLSYGFPEMPTDFLG